MSSVGTCNQDHFWAALVKLRDFRAWTLHNKMDPWSTRQALITVLEMDKDAALERGVSSLDLARFDAGATGTAKRMIKKLRREEKRR